MITRLRLLAGAVALSLATALSHTAGAGTVALLKDLDPSEVVASSYPWYLGVAGSRALFAGEVPGRAGRRLFRTDGTSAGTVRVEAPDLFEPGALATLNGRVLLIGYSSPGQVEASLWTTDGTDSGTVKLQDLGSSNYNIRLLAANTTRAFVCVTPQAFSGCELYVTDGTSAGTLRLATNRRVIVARMNAAGDLYFFSSAPDGSDRALWVSDGTVAGTRALLSAAAMGFEAFGPIAWIDANHLYLNAQLPGPTRGLFSVHLATGVVVKLADNGFSDFAENPDEIGGVRYFVMDGALWRSDGTPAGTTQLTTYVPPNGTQNQRVQLGNRIVFVHSDDTTGTELWATDGTPGGTQMLREISPGLDGSVQLLASTADHAFFVAGQDGAMHFWITDGTTAGTRMIARRGGGAYALQGANLFSGGVVVGSQVFLTALVDATPPNGYRLEQELWVTDLVGSDALRLGFGGNQLQAFGNRALFANPVADDLGVEPWISDGTVAGTTLVRNVAVSGQTAHSSPLWTTIVGDRAFFSAADVEHGRELWITDGSAAGTRRVRDLRPGPDHGLPFNFQPAGGQLLFAVAETPPWSDARLWRSDGTEAGTVKIGEVAPQEAGCGDWAASMNGRVWFLGLAGQYGPVEMWSTDLTAAGTRREFEMPDDIRNRPVCHLQVTPNGMVFAAGSTSTLASLWHTDGTAAGTMRLGAIQPVAAGTNTRETIATVGGIVYLLADDPNGTGRELWRTDGTSAGTTLVADLAPGEQGAQQLAMRAFRNALVFTYRSQDGTADGLYVIPTPGAAPVRLKAGTVKPHLPATSAGVYFIFNDAGGDSLWITDGTAAGTRQVHASTTPLPENHMVAGTNFLFMYGQLDASGSQMWFTNGQAGGTHRLSNFAAGTFFLDPNWVVLNDRALFVRDDLVTGSEPWMVVNAPPVAVADAASTARNTSVLVLPRANDTDSDSADAIVTLAIVTQPASGTLVAEGGGFRYTPNAGFTGSDGFEYRLTDEFGAQSALTRVAITVNAPPSTGTSGRKKGGGGLDLLVLAALLAGLFVRRTGAKQ